MTVVNPGNHSAVSMPLHVMEKIVPLRDKYHAWLIVDNTYEHFDHSHANRQINNNGEKIPFKCFNGIHVINIFSLSKCFSLAGFRVGYLTTSNEKDGALLMEQLKKVSNIYNIRSPHSMFM